MHIDQLIDPADLKAGIDAKLINIREDDSDLRILNYSDAAMYTPGAWDNPAVRQCRGLIIASNGIVVARPWAKFFNHGQAEAGELDLTSPVEVTDKLDGSLGILYYNNDSVPCVATRGSFASEQALHATEVLRDRYDYFSWDDTEWTPLVEIIYPENRIVCDYGCLDDLILLGAVGVETGEYLGPDEARMELNWLGPTAETFSYDTLKEALEAPPRPGKEGLCVRYLYESRIVKIKQEDYVRLHRIVTGLSERTVWEHMCASKPLGELLDGLPDELHPWVEEVYDDLLNRAVVIYEHAWAMYGRILSDLGTRKPERKAFALEAQKYPEVRPYLFLLLDGRDIVPSIMRSLKPQGDTRAHSRTEDVA